MQKNRINTREWRDVSKKSLWPKSNHLGSPSPATTTSCVHNWVHFCISADYQTCRFISVLLHDAGIQWCQPVSSDTIGSVNPRYVHSRNQGQALTCWLAGAVQRGAVYDSLYICGNFYEIGQKNVMSYFFWLCLTSVDMKIASCLLHSLELRA